jgi:amino acid transporter
MGGFGALLITLSNLSPGIGVFVVGADVVHQAGEGTLLCFALAGLLGVPVAAAYAELSAAFPETGGEYTIAARTLGPGFAFAMLGLNLFTFTISPAAIGLGIASYLGAVFPGVPPVPIALAAVAAVTLLAVLNVRLNALVTGLFLAVELGALAGVAALGLGHPARPLAPLLVHPLAAGAHGLGPASLASLGLGVAAAIYAFDGYSSVVYLGEEIAEAPRRMARVIFSALGLGALFMLVPLAGVLIGAPDLSALFASERPVSAFVGAVGGATLARGVSLAVALALVNAMIASALMGGRQLYSSGRDRAWGGRASAALARLHPRFNSPWVATLAVGAVAMLWCLVKLNVLLILIGDGTAAIYACMCLAALAGRRRGVTDASPFRMRPFPLLPWLGLVALGALALADLFDPDGRTGLAVAGGVIAAAVLYYRLALRGRGQWRDRGPAADVVAG